MEIRFVVVTHCNADCYFCLNEYVGTKSPSFELYPLHYGRIMECAASLAVKDCTITGGEPTLRKDLAAIVSAIRPHASRITLISNGYRLADHLEAVKLIDELHISYHSMDEAEWHRITRVRGGPERVRKNLLAARKANPALRIKLNVVAEMQNSSQEEVAKYISLAREIQGELSLFKEGYFSFLAETGLEMPQHPQSADFWDLDSLGGVLIGRTERKKVYLVDAVRVALSLTSTDHPSWDSCWVTPLGGAFVDSRQRNRLVDLRGPVSREDTDMMRVGLNYLFREAEIAREMGGNPSVIHHPLYNRYAELIREREAVVETTDSVNIAGLVSWQKRK